MEIRSIQMYICAYYKFIYEYVHHVCLCEETYFNILFKRSMTI